MTRPEGFYWVNRYGEWVVAEWVEEYYKYYNPVIDRPEPGVWYLTGRDREYDDMDFREIGTHILPPEEQHDTP